LKNKKLIVGIVLLAFFIPSLSTASATITDTSLDDVITAGKLVIGVDAAYPPFEQMNTTTDEVEGFDPDIMAYIATDMDITVEYMDVAWDTIFTSLAAGNYDCVMSAVTITSERMDTMDFTRWYYFSTQAVMVTTANPKNITSVDDVNSTSIKVGVQAGTTSEWYLDDVDAEMLTYATITFAIDALKNGLVDAVLGDDATLVAGQVANPGDFIIVDKFSPEAFGIAFQKGSTALIERVNTVLDELLGTDEYNPQFSTYYNDTYEEWMGAEAIIDLDQLKTALDSYQETGGATISGLSILSLIAVIPVTVFGIIRKIRRKKD
jgi:polar amino acid transport system substrate-binding protein